ncbi:MAG: hypothetical protein PHC88_06960 [Terrimicrobiaceae bacterium]|nr:hypothetical protein [Terrimicrobiaceae bacterium]
MRRRLWALLFAVIAAAAAWFEGGPFGSPGRAWLGASGLPSNPETIAAVEVPATAERGIGALDAALVLRAVLRFAPKGIAFLDPIASGDGMPLLTSKLGDAKLPVVFTANAGGIVLPDITIAPGVPRLPVIPAAVPPGHSVGCAAPSGPGVLVIGRSADRAVPSSALQLLLDVDRGPTLSGKVPGMIRGGMIVAPVNVAGRSAVNSLAARFVERISLDRLLVRTEQSERGEIVADLSNLFRDRLIAVEIAGGGGAIGLAALRDNLADAEAPPAWSGFGVLLVASLPWWRQSRMNRMLAALAAACGWLLLAMALYQQFRIVIPLSVAPLLPLLALIPRGFK